MNEYGREGRKDSLHYKWEKALSLHIYLLRKPILAVFLVLLGMVRKVSNVLGFNCEASVSDREAWIWKPYKRVPFYRAYVEWEWERVN